MRHGIIVLLLVSRETQLCISSILKYIPFLAKGHFIKWSINGGGGGGMQTVIYYKKVSCKGFFSRVVMLCYVILVNSIIYDYLSFLYDYAINSLHGIGPFFILFCTKIERSLPHFNDAHTKIFLKPICELSYFFRWKALNGNAKKKVSQNFYSSAYQWIRKMCWWYWAASMDFPGW